MIDMHAVHGYAQQMMGANAGPPTSTVRPFRGPKDTLDQMRAAALGPRGEQSPLVRMFTESIVREITPKDYLGEILAIRNLFVQPSPVLPTTGLFRYTSDPIHLENVKDPERQVTEIMQTGTTLIDCDESALMAGTMCLVLGRKIEFVAMGFAPGSLSHVAVRAGEPKSGRWILLDGVAGPREKEAAGRARELLTYNLE